MADMELGEVRMRAYEDSRHGDRSRGVRDEEMDELEEKESGRHRSKDKKKGRREEKEHGSRERRKEDRSDPGKDRDNEKEYDRNREKSRDKVRDKDYDRDSKHRDREREKERKEERDRVREKASDQGRDKEKEKDRERGRNREREREKQRDRSKDRERDVERSKNREKEKDKEKDRERSKTEKEKAREKPRERDVDRSWEKEQDRSRARDREKENRGKEVEKDGKVTSNSLKDGAFTGKEESRYEDGVQEKQIESTSLLEERLVKIKEERLKDKSDGASDILSWVSKSRRLEEKRNAEKEKTLRLSKALEEQDNILEESEDDEAAGNSRDNLAGVKILHGLDKVIEGGAVVLTLKDQNILAGGDINEDVDMLENVEIGEQKQRDEAYRVAKKKTGIYDDKFSDDTGSRRPILPQYDDEIEDEGVTLDEAGRFSGEAEKRLEELRKRIEGSSTQIAYEDLTSTGRISSDYYTPDEMLQFKKPKKKKSLRKKEKLDLDALESEAIAAGLGAGDLGSRKDLRRQIAREEEERAEAEKRSNAYQSAIAKAEEASKVLRQEQTLTVTSGEEDDLVFGEDYEDLQRSLEQARKLALRKQDEGVVSVPQAVALLATENREQDNTSSIEGEAQENKVVITEMEEFVLGLQLNEDARKPEAEDVFMDEDDEPKHIEQEAQAEVVELAEVKENNVTEELIDEEEPDVVPDEIIHEVAVGKGLAGALKLLHNRGTLSEGVDLGGRNMDKKKSKLVGIYDNDGTKEIRIDRTDEFGRILTPKEAFRIISHKFHGKGPGKMKQEKRMKQYQEDLKTKQMKASDTPLLAMEKMREAQARMKTPYLVLSGHVKPGQTSDPRSGFATVEKDHLGSLTPMLGDKKVEHFLGIKRNSEPGSMGPPPPKRPKN
ncbi:SART-1 family protein DOT2 [Typha latifolia]|uniref:SART-1 family protein DOT2 n=1 Tax=Typha latifolia TaxID=4733 RepID=UPI003C30604D